MPIWHNIIASRHHRHQREKGREEMQCSSHPHCHWVSMVYPPTPTLKTWCFQPQFSFGSPQLSHLQPQQQQTNFGSDDDALLPAKWKLITSTSNPFVKHCLKLRNSSSYRRSHGEALVVGSTPIREIYRFQESLQAKSVRMDCLILPEKAEIPNGLNKSPTCIVRVSSTVMRKLSGLQSTDSIDAIALMKIPASFFNVDGDQNKADCQKWFPSAHRILVLDGIQDPGNLGTLLRSAVAFRWDGVFLLPGCCDPFNEKAVRASRGASFQLPVVSGCWNHLESLKDELQMKLLAGHPQHEDLVKPVCSLSPSLCDSLSDTPLCLVLGSEGRGLSEKSLQSCELVSISMAGEFESLNVSVAGGIFLHMLQPKNR